MSLPRAASASAGYSAAHAAGQLSGGGAEAATYQFLVYVDREEYPTKIQCTIDSVRGLVSHLQQALERPVARLSIWDNDFQQYIPFTSLNEVRDFKARLAVDTGGVRVSLVREDVDALEHNAVREHVDKLGPPRDGCSYQLVEAHRIINPDLERAFQNRRGKLCDPKVRSMMLFYTNNARPSEQVVQHGFAMPAAGQGPNAGQGIVFATDIDAQPALNTNLKFLLCEVAVGRTFTVRSADRLTSQLRGFDLGKYDSLLNLTQRDNGGRIDEWVIFNADQAVPRYIVTCNVAKGAAKVSWNFAAMGCERHPGESLKLWCVPCRQLMCPYCMTIGAHKGHEGKEVSEVATFEKQVVIKMNQTLDKTLQRRQEEAAELERVKLMLAAVAKKGEENIRRVIAELHQMLAVEEQQLVTNLVARRANAVAELDRGLHVVQQAAADLSRKQHDALRFAELPVESSQQAAAEFLSGLQGTLDVLHAAPAYDDQTTTTVSVPELHATVDYEEAKHGIQSLALTDATHSDGGHGSKAPSGGLNGGGTVPRAALDSELARLRDIETGYIWIIPNASQHFALSQKKDVFSDVFQLLGTSWEMRVTSQPEEHVSVFLHAANHVHRMDFRVTLISPNGWYTRHAKNWLDSFRGRGWGIKPYADKRSLHSTYIHDGVLKICITPTSGLY
jgi:hypothetical protein